MNLNLITINDNEKFLRQVSKEVDFDKDNYLEYIEHLKNYCENNAVFALAPIQIGIPKRIIYIKNTTPNMNNNFDKSYNEGIILINPKILESHGTTRFLEGCQSCSISTSNNENIYLVCEVERPYSVTIEYYDVNQNLKTKVLEGFECTVFCHEFDHLNGILHIDKTDTVYKMTTDEMKKYRNDHPYEILSK